MSNLNVVVVLVAGLVGGLWGWRVGTKRIYRRSVFAEDGDGGARRRRQRVVQRYFITVLYAAFLGGGIALLLAMIKR